MKLAEQQQALADWVLSASNDNPKGIAPPAADNANIYRGSILELHLRSIESDIPVFAALLGADGCRNLLRRYLSWRLQQFGQFNPVGTRSLDAIGEDLPQFVSDFAALAEWPYFADLLRLELAVASSGRRGEVTPPSQAELLQFAEQLQGNPNAKLVLAPALQMLRSDYAIDDLWDSENGGAPVADILANRHLLIYQQQDSVRIQAIDLTTWRLLTLLSEVPNWLEAQQAWLELGWPDPTSALIPALQQGWLLPFSAE